MTKLLLSGALALLLGSNAASVVHADDLRPAQKKVTIKLGALFPTNGDVKRLGDTWFTAGVDVVLGKTKDDAPLLPLVYIDYMQKKNGNVTIPFGNGTFNDGARVTTVGVGLGVRGYMKSASATGVIPYYGAGVGAYFSQGRVQLLKAVGSNLYTDAPTQNRTNLGVKFNVGAELHHTFIVEGGYTYAGSFSNADLGGLTLMVGARF